MPDLEVMWRQQPTGKDPPFDVNAMYINTKNSLEAHTGLRSSCVCDDRAEHKEIVILRRSITGFTIWTLFYQTTKEAPKALEKYL
jgi:hypothetical protein